MKQRAITLGAALLGGAFLIASCQQAIDSTDLSRDGSFEGIGLGDSWRYEAFKGDLSQASVDAALAHTGRSSVHLVSKSLNHASVIQKIKVEPNAAYVVTAWVRTKDVGLDNKGANLGAGGVFGSSVDVRGSQDFWSQLQLGIETGDEIREATVMLNLGSYGSLNTGEAWFDDVVIQRVPQVPANLASVTLVKEKPKEDLKPGALPVEPLRKLLIVGIVVVLIGIGFTIWLVYSRRRQKMLRLAREATMAVEIRNVTNDKKGMKQFMVLPWEMYKNDPHWAPDLIMDLKKRLDKKAHPFFEFGDAEFFLALRGETVVGRIAAIENQRHVEYRKEKIGFWGFFECENNQETANALFAAAKTWVAAKGYSAMRGPMSCDTQDEVGMVIEGFDQMRYFIMPHNPAYYVDLCAKAGMTKAKDLICFHLNLREAIPEREARIAEIAKQRMEKRGFSFRNLNKKEAIQDFRQIMEIYHEGWKDNWGFVPASERQFMELANNMKSFAEDGLVIIIEGPVDPETGKRPPVAMAVALYDYMESTHYARKYPLWLQEIAQIVNFAWRLFVRKKPKFARGRLFLAGVMPQYRGQGMDALLYVLPFQAGKDHGVVDAELSWELEDNIAIISPIEKMGGKVYRRLRVWDVSTK